MNTRQVFLGFTAILILSVAISGCNPEQPPVAPPPEAPGGEGAGDPGGKGASSAASAAHRFTNQLAGETSPYLLQHAHNPVNWHPWGPAALAKAKRENKPIFLSVGYSTCYWCHVMERESFENEDVAKILNEHFIAIKVDREERPDVDEQYMLATQLMTGRGGWPNSVWLTPDGRPWMAGTYFPPQQFVRLLNRLADLWHNDRQLVETQADQLAAAIRQASQAPPQDAHRAADQQLVDRALDVLRADYDGEYAGFSNRQKFPPHAALRLLIDEYRRTEQPALLDMTAATLDAMAHGGIRDHLGGGFHRYATDRQWFLPHFEKMLYDNAQLIRLFADGYLLTGDEAYREVVADIFAWLDRDMTDAAGGFYSALDSESDGEEGRFYVWEYDELLRVLGEEPGKQFAKIYGCKPSGNWTEEATGHPATTNILHLPSPLDVVAEQQRIGTGELHDRLREQRQALLEVRNLRPRPHLDDKILASWNGLMISALAYAGRQLEEPRYTAAAERAARFVLEHMTAEDGGLLRTYRQDTAKLPGYLDDYALVADGLLELHSATGDAQWLDAARQLAERVQSDFEDQENHAFYYTSAQHDELLLRSKNLLGGGNVPSANAVAMDVLTRLSQATGEEKYRKSAGLAVAALAGRMWQAPRGAEDLIAAAANHAAATGGASDSSPRAAASEQQD